MKKKKKQKRKPFQTTCLPSRHFSPQPPQLFESTVSVIVIVFIERVFYSLLCFEKKKKKKKTRPPRPLSASSSSLTCRVDALARATRVRATRVAGASARAAVPPVDLCGFFSRRFWKRGNVVVFVRESEKERKRGR